MEDSKSFVLWFITNIPQFFLTQPIASFVGLGFLAWTIKIFARLKNI